MKLKLEKENVSKKQKDASDLIIKMSKPGLNDVLEDVFNRPMENHLKYFRDKKGFIPTKPRYTDYSVSD